MLRTYRYNVMAGVPGIPRGTDTPEVIADVLTGSAIYAWVAVTSHWKGNFIGYRIMTIINTIINTINHDDTQNNNY